MSTTIDSLDIQITTSAGQAEKKIGDLADALGRLKENGKITVATNGLKKLGEALNTLNPALNGLNAAKLRELKEAVAGLSGIQKLSGLNSAVNTLKKIPDVISKLDATDLAKFATQMERLSDALKPLATQIDKIGSGFSKLPNQISKTVTATNKMAAATEKAAAASVNHGKALDTSGINIMAAISNFESLVHVANIVSGALEKTMAEAMEWDGIQYRFGRAFGEDAEEVYEYVQKINDVLGINIQQFMQYSSLYGSLLSGFGMAQEKVTTISIGLTELSYDIWAAYNDRFKTLEDASEAVRSAITGEIEPIRNAGIALTEASLQEYLDQVGMAHVSIEKLSEAQKAEVRYAAMVNAAMNQGIVGTYASEMQTAEGAVRSLSQSFKGLIQAFGSLFIPLLQLVIPYLTAFVELLYEAIAAIASFFGIAFFEIDWGGTSGGVGDIASGMEDAAVGAGGVASGLEDAAGAAKKLKDYTLGFDELNVISPPSESGSGGGGGGAGGGGVGDSGWGDGLDLDTLWDDSVFAKASKQVDELKEKIKDWFEEWKTEIAIISAALGVIAITPLLTQLGEALDLGEGFLNTMGKIKKLATSVIVVTVQYALMSELLDKFMSEEGEIWDYVTAMLVGAASSWVLYKQWGPAGLAVGFSVIAYASLETVIENGGVTDGESALVALTGVAAGAGAIAAAWKVIKPVFEGIKEFFSAAKDMAPQVGWFAALFPKLSSALAPVVGWITSAVKAVGAFLGGITAPAWATIVAVVAAIASAVYFLYKNWGKVTEAVKKFYKTDIAPKLEKIKKHFVEIWEAIEPLVDALVDFGRGVAEFLEPAITAVKDFLGEVNILAGIGKVIEFIGGVVFAVFGAAVAGTFNAVISAIENFVQIFSGIIQVVSGVIQFIVALFTGGDIEGAWTEIWDGVKDIAGGLWGLLSGAFSNFWEGVIGWFATLFEELTGKSVPKIINGIIEWFKELPGRASDALEDFSEGVSKKFGEMWENIKAWFNTSVAPKFTRAYWREKFDGIVSGAGSKLTDLKTKISEKWGAIKTWYTTNVAPKFTSKYWKDEFDGIKDGLDEKLEDAWEAVKDFFDPAEWKKKVEDAVEAIRKNFKMPEFPKIGLEVTYSTDVGKAKKLVYEALGLEGWPSLRWKAYAAGGFPSVGEMFIAREAGPEMVGSIGSRTAVANNDQIVAAVSQGVYSAVVAAMSANTSNNGQSVNVYLDGKQIYSSVKRVEAERGVAVMGTQLGYGF